jgi:hypothetical protein
MKSELIVGIVTTRVWQRYGQLRIYVLAAELEVGWSDPRSGRFVLKVPELEEAFWAEVEAECQRLRQDGRLTGPALPPVPGPGVPRRRPQVPARRLGGVSESGDAPDPDGGAGEWPAGEHWVMRDPRADDLACNKPGAAARARGRELRREHLLLTTTADLLGIRTAAKSFATGARGERVVGRKLERWAARYGWQVLHAVPVGQRGTDIDHVVIAPFGVVTVNTKVTGTAVWVGEYGMTVGGMKVDYVRKSRAEAGRARKLLARAVGASVPVRSAIVFVGARRFTMAAGGPPDVAVLRSPAALRRWLRKQPSVLSPGQVEQVYQAARKPASWQARQPWAR